MPFFAHANFNPRAPYGARLQAVAHHGQLFDISIHAPHTGRDRCLAYNEGQCSEFQSTRPIRGATEDSIGDRKGILDFNPRAPYGARRVQYPITIQQQDLFQSTRPIRGATPFLCVVRLPRLYFNPRAPYGARLFKRLFVAKVYKISIHAPHTGRDHKAVLA